MYNFTFTNPETGDTWTRITKTAARKAYNAGADVLIVPCNIRPFNAWGLGALYDNSVDLEFDQLVNDFNYWNCTNSQTGRAAAFYIMQREAAATALKYTVVNKAAVNV